MPFGPLLVFVLASLALVFSPSSAFAEDTPAEDTRPVIRIGLIAPVTGNLAYIGEDIIRWHKLALQDFTSPSDTYRYEVLIEDDQAQPRQSVLAARRLASTQKANILLTYGSGPGVAVAPVANMLKTPHLAIAYDPRATVGDYNLTMVNPIEDCIPAFLQFLEKKDYHNIALMGVRSSTWQTLFDNLDELHASGKINLNYKRIYQPGERDFRLGIQQIPDDTDVLLIVSWPPELNIIARQFKEQNRNIPLAGIAGSFIFSKDRTLFEGCIDTYFFDLVKGDEINRKLTGSSVYSGGGLMLYDEIYYIHQIFESFPNAIPSGDEVLAHIHQLGQINGPMLGEGILGEDKAFHYPPNYYRIQGGNISIVPLEEL